MFSYNCQREEITAVLAYDVWSDDTEGYPERKSGGVGQDAVSIRVTSQYRRGFTSNLSYIVDVNDISTHILQGA